MSSGTGTQIIDWSLQYENFGGSGPPYGSTSVPGGSFPSYQLGPKIHAVDPGPYFEQAESLGFDTNPWEGLANQYECPRGKRIGKGYLLLNFTDASYLDLDNTYTLTITDGTNTATIPNLYIVRVTALFGDIGGPNPYPASPDDPNQQSSSGTYPNNASGSSAPGTGNSQPTSGPTVCLVEIADKRRLMSQTAFNLSGSSASSYNGRFNVRYAAACGQPTPKCYDPNSINTSGTPTAWTWQQILDTIWASGIIGGCGYPSAWYNPGTSPTLPTTAISAITPEGFQFQQWTAWDAYNYIASRQFCELVYNPLTAAFSLVRLGDLQSGLAAAIQAAETNSVIVDHNDTLQGQAANAPSRVLPLFRQLLLHYQIDPNAFSVSSTPSIDNKGWVTIGYGSASPPPNSVVGTKIVYVDDLPSLLDANGNTKNTSDLNTRTNEIAQNFSDYYANANYFVCKRYFGVVTTLLPGSQISCIRWVDIGDGLHTEVEAISDPAFANSWSEPASFSPEKEMGGYPFSIRLPNRSVSLPDSMRQLSPYQPTVDQLIQITSTGPNSDGLLSGNIMLVDPLTTNTPLAGQDAATRFKFLASSNGVACWILPLDYFSSHNLPSYSGFSPSNVLFPFDTQAKELFGAIRIGRVVGSKVSGGTLAPLVALHTGYMNYEYYGNAVANWMTGSGVLNYVRVQTTGTNNAGASAPIISVAISFGLGNRDPNIVSGTRIRYRFDLTGRPWMMNPELLDEPISKLILSMGSPRGNPSAWGKADGTGNSSANGGTGYNFYQASDGSLGPYLIVKTPTSGIPVLGGRGTIPAGTTGASVTGDTLQTGAGGTTVGDGGSPIDLSITQPTHTHTIASQALNPFSVGVDIYERLNNSVTAAGYTP